MRLPVRELFVELFQRVRFKLGLDRKNFVLKHIRHNGCRSIMEIGVFNGNFAKRMLEVAVNSNPDSPIYYTGVDLFSSNFTPEIKEKEVAVTPQSIEFVRSFLSIDQVRVDLYEGWSFEILPKIQEKFDLIVIDGGHSYETVKNDFELASKMLTRNGTIILDDFTNANGERFGGFGINRVVSEIDRSKYTVKLSWNRDYFLKSYGLLELRMVKVSRR